ncbi:MAG: hypothetical protein PVJ21_18420 [Anaerolineales bacterium]|jgi:hypothetical protein
MKRIKFTTIHFMFMLVLVNFMGLSACTASADLAEQTGIQTAEDPITYKEITLPAMEDISFELPEDWESWANAGYLSPDDGKTYAGVRLVWIKEGQDAEALLYNEGSILHDKTTVMVGSLETHRYIVEVTLTNTITQEIISHTYEMIYSFPSPDGELMTGVVFSAEFKHELESLVPIAEHMVQSLKWGGRNE